MKLWGNFAPPLVQIIIIIMTMHKISAVQCLKESIFFMSTKRRKIGSLRIMEKGEILKRGSKFWKVVFGPPRKLWLSSEIVFNIGQYFGKKWSAFSQCFDFLRQSGQYVGWLLTAVVYTVGHINTFVHRYFVMWDIFSTICFIKLADRHKEIKYSPGKVSSECAYLPYHTIAKDSQII